MKKKVQGVEEVSSNLCGCYSEENGVVCKQSVIDGWHTIPKGEAWKGTFRLKSKQCSAKGINNENVKKGGERAPLPYPLGGFKKIRGPTIDEGGYPGLADAGLDLGDEFGGKTKSQHHLEEEWVAYSIKRIGHIKFHRHSFISVLLARVYGFLY